MGAALRATQTQRAPKAPGPTGNFQTIPYQNKNRFFLAISIADYPKFGLSLVQRCGATVLQHPCILLQVVALQPEVSYNLVQLGLDGRKPRVHVAIIATTAT